MGNLTPSDYKRTQKFKHRLINELPQDILYCNGFAQKQALMLEWLAQAELQFGKFINRRLQKIRDDRWRARERVFLEAIKGAKDV